MFKEKLEKDVYKRQGSTPDSDSVCEGSNPSPAAKPEPLDFTEKPVKSRGSSYFNTCRERHRNMTLDMTKPTANQHALQLKQDEAYLTFTETYW